MKYFQIQGVKIQYCIIAASLMLLSIFFLVFTTEITTKSIGTLGKETQSSQKQPSTTIGHIPQTTPVTNKEQLGKKDIK